MRTRSRIAFILVAVLLVAAGALTFAQKVKPPEFGTPPSKAGRNASPVILSGEDIGFRVDATRNGVPVGVLVVRVNGKWVEAQAQPTYAK